MRYQRKGFKGPLLDFQENVTSAKQLSQHLKDTKIKGRATASWTALSSVPAPS